MFEHNISIWTRVWMVIMISLFVFVTLRSVAFGEEGPYTCHSEIWRSAQELQPWFKSRDVEGSNIRLRQLEDLTEAICEASKTTGIDHRLALAVAFRESSLRPQIGMGKKNGARGERGYFQIMPGSSALVFSPGKCSQHTPICNAVTALGYMRSLKSVCLSESPWVWLAAYGRGRCDNEHDAREFKEMRLARSYLCKITPEHCDSIWPQ